MRAAGIKFLRRDNCFAWVENVRRFSILMDEQVRFDWEKALGKLSREINPALPSIVGTYGHPLFTGRSIRVNGPAM